MLRKILFAFFCLFISLSSYAGDAINVEWVHKFIKQEHGLDIPYADNPKLAVNMDYLLKMVDIANAMLNGPNWTNYGEDPEYATREVADTVAGEYCIRNLIEHYYFTATTTADTTSFSFQIGANGTYHIDWGDGTREHYYKSSVGDKAISHTYKTAGEYNIHIGGYSRDYPRGAISFHNNKQLAGISGSLGKIFPTLKNKIHPTQPIQPSFASLFENCSNLGGTIPPDLFAGVHGQAKSSMFVSSFEKCINLEGAIPENLFRVSGVAYYLFFKTFLGCTKLSGEIPPMLFAKIKGLPLGFMFACTFQGCSGLTGVIDKRLFENISGSPDDSVFNSTFHSCSGLTGIEAGLFAGIDGAPADSMFGSTFYGCTGLQGIIPPNLFGNIHGAPQPHMFAYTFAKCSGLSGSIPDMLFGDFENNAPASFMFRGTFLDCTGLTGSIPKKLFYRIQGKPAQYMYNQTFNNCNKLTGAIPDGLFGVFDGAPALSMFDGAFAGCTGLGTNISEDDMPQYMRDGYAIPPNLFAGISGAPAASMYNSTFSGCSGLVGAIPNGLFGKFYANDPKPQGRMFTYTFFNCSGLTGSIPGDLFAGISGAPAVGMFYGTFAYCGNLTGAIPDGLFGDIRGNPQIQMFADIFRNCGKLGTGITEENMPQYMRDGYAFPLNLFGDIYGAPAQYMFANTFNGCGGLTGSIPPDLFGGVRNTDGTILEGTSAIDMFAGTFANSNITGEIPSELFGNIATESIIANSFRQMFDGCKQLTGPSARLNGRYLYEIWPDSTQVQLYMYRYCTNLSDYDQIPAAWK